VRVGIVIPAWNVAPFIGDALGSLIAQTWPDWRAVVVDDGSSDPTFDVAAAITDPRISVVRQDNAGVSAARNRGLAALDADAFLFLDADDWLLPDALARMVRALAPRLAAVGVAGRSQTVLNRSPVQWVPATAKQWPAIGLQALLWRNPFINGGQLLLRGTAVRAAGAFRTDLRFGEDWEYWVRLCLHGPFATIPEVVCRVHARTGSAYRTQATDPGAIVPCLDAIFGNPALIARMGTARLSRLRQQAEAENAWVVGRELIRHGRVTAGMGWLFQSLGAAPSARRAALAAGALTLSALPPRCRGPLRPYP
jgi:Glycosyl transferase family 2